MLGLKAKRVFPQSKQALSAVQKFDSAGLSSKEVSVKQMRLASDAKTELAAVDQSQSEISREL